MANIQKVPNDVVDLSYLAVSYDNTLPTLYPLARVYGPDNAEISGSPFTLVSIGNNLYGLNSAFQIDADSGTYKVVYEFYEDAGHTVKSGQIGQAHDTITVSIPYSSGLGNSGGGSFIYDDSELRRIIQDYFSTLNEKYGDLYDKVVKAIEIVSKENPVFGKILEEIKSVQGEIAGIKLGEEIPGMIKDLKASQKNWFKNLLEAIKKNRSTIIKSKFDKKLMSPVLETCANTDLRMTKELMRLKKDLTATIDMKNELAEKNNIKIMDGIVKVFADVVNDLNESVRKKLKFAVEELKVLVIRGKVQKQDIKITLQKED